ncbi:MAG TPA: peptidylprolyl isomerase [Candidatus Limnocylindrales bacterium]|nr:peptidylprolyl isomerase [Candidatus Limnocylindrales bacterium]
MPRRQPLALCLALSLALATLAVPATAQDAERPVGPPTSTPNPVALEAPAGDGTGMRLTTDLGDIVIGLFNESAPVAAENFQNLVAAGFYDGVGFHRVAPGFVLQGGDPEGTGGGGPGYTIADEEVVGRYGRGIVAMARTPLPDSQGSQFFIVLDDGAEGSLDQARTYVIFGRVVEGMDVVDAIVARGPASDLIDDPVRIRSASIEQVELPPEPTLPPPTTAEIAAEALLARLPAQVAGIELIERAAFSSDQISPGAPAQVLAALAAAAQAHGTDLERLSLARAAGGDGDTFANIVAGSIAGVPADEVLMPLASLVLGMGDPAVTDETIAGRAVKRLELSPGQFAYAVPSRDVVWFLVADEASLEEIVSSLP